MNFVTLSTNNNVFPCEGPKCIPIKFIFLGAETQEIDLVQQVQSNKISLIQSLYVDNSTNAASIDIVSDVTDQLITVPANSQGYVQLLGANPPRFSVTATGAANVTIHALNFPVLSTFWSVL